MPGHYDGRNETFWFFAYEGLRDAIPEPDIFTVPSAAERNGDFSALLSQNITIYDPATAVKVTSGTNKGRVRRSPMPCDGRMNVICPDRLSPIAQAYLKFYPLPNTAGDAQGRRNFITPNARNDLFDSENARVDHILTNKQKFFARFSRNWRRELRGSWTGEQNGIIPSGNYLFRVNNSATYDHLYTFSASALLDVRVGFSRFVEQNVRPSGGRFDPATLGFSPQTVALFRGVQYLPRFQINGFNSLGDTVGGVITFNIYSVQPSFSLALPPQLPAIPPPAQPNRLTLRWGFGAVGASNRVSNHARPFPDPCHHPRGYALAARGLQKLPHQAVSQRRTRTTHRNHHQQPARLLPGQAAV